MGLGPTIISRLVSPFAMLAEACLLDDLYLFYLTGLLHVMVLIGRFFVGWRGVWSDDASPAELEARGDDILGAFPSGVTVLEVCVAAWRGVTAAVWYARFCFLFVLVGVEALSWCVAELLLLGSVVVPDSSSLGSGPGSSMVDLN